MLFKEAFLNVMLQKKSGEKKSFAQIMNSDSVSGYIFILPFVIGFLVFTVFPMLASLVLSFTDYDMLSAPVFVGLKNYKQMFTQDPLIYKTLFNTFYFTVTSVPLKLAFALMVAMLLVNTNKITSIYRAMFYLPSMVGGSVAIAVLWRRMFAGDGLVNALLGAVGLPDDVYWLGNENTAIWTWIILAVWQFGSPMLIFVAGLKQIPSSLYEAATVDGAGPVRKFFKITLPMLSPTIFFNLIMQMIGALTAFTQCFIITNGKPLDSTLFYAVYLYRQSLTYSNMGYGSAMAWLMVVIIGTLTAIVFKTSDKWVYEG